ncbi:ATP-binding protein [Streptomyces griseoviridis]|uniref:sensor histidine kinase n=1 Tax=Streptomyces griseoviridis TaxID=45398 RepID=UPI00344E34BF
MPARVSPARPATLHRAPRRTTSLERTLRHQVHAPVVIPVVAQAVLLVAAVIASTTTRLPAGTLLAAVAVGGFLAALTAAHRARTAVTSLRRTFDDLREADLATITEAAHTLDRSVRRAVRDLRERDQPPAPEGPGAPTPERHDRPASEHPAPPVPGSAAPPVPENAGPPVPRNAAAPAPDGAAPSRSGDPAERVVRLLDGLRDDATTALARVRHDAPNEIVRHLQRHVTQRQLSTVGRALHALSAVQWLTDEPVLLDEIYRVDHLVTRMRRLVESRAVLSAEPLRRGRRPVDVTTVLRGAVSEATQYPRAIVEGGPDGTDLALPGHVGPDLAHLLAELVDNACDNSDPATLVHLRARRVEGGLAIEVEDRAAPMSPQRRARLNALLREPEGPDAGEQVRKGQLGLLTVARIARRHGVRVHLLANASDGTTALVTVPAALLVDAQPPAPVRIPLPLRSVGPGPDLLSGRSARTVPPVLPRPLRSSHHPAPQPPPAPADVPLPRRTPSRPVDGAGSVGNPGRKDLAAAFRRDLRATDAEADGASVLPLAPPGDAGQDAAPAPHR